MLRGQGWRLATWNVELLAASESNVRHGQLPAEGPVRPLVPLCFGCEAKDLEACKQECGANFLPRQKATLGTGSFQPQASSVLEFHGVSVLRRQGLGSLQAEIWS